MIRTSFRLPEDLLQRLDDIARTLQKQQVGTVTRADVLRMLLEKGLAFYESEARASRARRPRKEAKIKRKIR